MQTLISVFDDRAKARRAVARLVEAGFAPEDVHLEECPVATAAIADDDAQNRAVGERTMASPEREVAVDAHALESVGNFFSRLFGMDRHEGVPVRYSKAVTGGRSVVVVDAHDDQRAEAAAVMLHDLGAVEVDDEHGKERVRAVRRESQPPLRDLVAQRQLDEMPH